MIFHVCALDSVALILTYACSFLVLCSIDEQKLSEVIRHSPLLLMQPTATVRTTHMCVCGVCMPVCVCAACACVHAEVCVVCMPMQRYVWCECLCVRAACACVRACRGMCSVQECGNRAEVSEAVPPSVAHAEAATVCVCMCALRVGWSRALCTCLCV